VHTTDAAHTIDRIVSTFPAEEQRNARVRLAENLRATLSQRLLPRAKGKGMVLAVEVMICTGHIREVIAQRMQGSIKELIESGREQYGMQSFDQHLAELFEAGAITRAVAVQAASNPADFARKLQFS